MKTLFKKCSNLKMRKLQKSVGRPLIGPIVRQFSRDALFDTPVITIFASDIAAIKPQEVADKIS